jgi:hypothetical protein
MSSSDMAFPDPQETKSMKLEAFLTVGWEDDPQANFSAFKLHEAADPSSPQYSAALTAELGRAQPETVLLGLENLFRRRPGDFGPLKQFVGALASMRSPGKLSEPLVCRIDVFAYFFLKSAKNLDFVLPRRGGGNDEFDNLRETWAEKIRALERFERTGEALPAGTVEASRYLGIREIISRPSARDELRALTVLLTSGPSTLAEISDDLGLNYPLGQRALAAYEHEAVGVVERRRGEIFTIVKDYLPLVVFCLREKMGIDLLPAEPGE